MKANPVTSKKAVSDSEYRALAEFRFHIRRYLDFSDKAAKTAGLEPKQYQLLLAIKGSTNGSQPTVGSLAQQLHIRHHSTVELINRAEENRLVQRSRAGSFVYVLLTRQGERVLAKAVKERLKEVRRAGPVLVEALQRLITQSRLTVIQKKK